MIAVAVRSEDERKLALSGRGPREIENGLCTQAK